MTDAMVRLAEANPVRRDALDGDASFEELWRRFEDASAARSHARRRGSATVARLATRPRLVGLLLVVLVAAASAGAAVSLSGGRAVPVRVPGGSSLCPAGYEYVAYASLGLFYPPNYPDSLPRGSTATGCYASPHDAHAAGYRIAPTPRGDRRLGPLYLAPASAGVRRTCRAARRRGVPVFCPRVLPAPWLDPINAVNPDCPSAGCGAPLLSLWGCFSAPSSFVGSAPGVGEVTVSAVPRRWQRLYSYEFGCRSARPLSTTVFRGHPATWYACSIFGSATSSVLEWRIGTVQYEVSADGPADLRRRLVTYIAAHLSGPSAAR